MTYGVLAKHKFADGTLGFWVMAERDARDGPGKMYVNEDWRWFAEPELEHLQRRGHTVAVIHHDPRTGKDLCAIPGLDWRAVRLWEELSAREREFCATPTEAARPGQKT